VQDENKDTIEKLHGLRARSVDLTPEFFQSLQQLFNDPAIQKVMSDHTEQLTITHLGYFFSPENSSRIMQDDYMPSSEDVLRCRQRTAGANSTSIYMDKTYFEFFDIGGQKPERAKWEAVLSEHKFSAILYFVAADEYDVPDEEKEYIEKTKLDISKLIFTDLVSSGLISKEIPVVLFLNRKDLFEKRIAEKESYESFTSHFPDYNGGQDAQHALDYLRDNFKENVRDQSNPLRIHATCAVERESMVVVWRTVREFLLKQALADIGLLNMN